jgi:hypothetical protein
MPAPPPDPCKDIPTSVLLRAAAARLAEPPVSTILPDVSGAAESLLSLAARVEALTAAAAAVRG